jgi:hypothetical protein
MHTPVPTWVKFDVRRVFSAGIIALVGECAVRENGVALQSEGVLFVLTAPVGIE